ncbi:MAG: NYN domain-containing protein [Clostridiaceae bacterium]
MDNELKYALLIDAENVSSKYIELILDEMSNYGVTTYRRIYGDWTSNANISWKEILLKYSITPVQQYRYVDGKNASDSALIIDAMDILYSGNVDGFCLVTSDSDFTRLASRLRESAKVVIGMGESKTPSAFINACNQFKYIDILYNKQKEALAARQPAPEPEKTNTSNAKQISKRKTRASRVKQGQAITTNLQNKFNSPIVEVTKPSPQPQTKLSTIRKALRSIIEENSSEDGWIASSKLGNLIAKRFPDFDVRNYGYSKLNLFIDSLSEFEMDSQPNKPGSKVQHIYFRIREESDELPF